MGDVLVHVDDLRGRRMEAARNWAFRKAHSALPQLEGSRFACADAVTRYEAIQRAAIYEHFGEHVKIPYEIIGGNDDQ